MVYIDTDEIYDSIIEHYDKEKHKQNDTWYYDSWDQAIDDYCFILDARIAKEVVDEYGVFKAIKLYEDKYGEYVVYDSESKNYLMLFYVIVEERLLDEYQEKLKNYKGEDENKFLCNENKMQIKIKMQMKMTIVK